MNKFDSGYVSRKEQLQGMADQGRLGTYLTETYQEDDLVRILMDGFTNREHDDLKNYLDAEDGQLTQAEMEKEENAWLNKRR